MTTTIPARFLAGSTDPATAYTVGELRELLAELPEEMNIFGDYGNGVSPTVVETSDGEGQTETILAFWPVAGDDDDAPHPDDSEGGDHD